MAPYGSLLSGALVVSNVEKDFKHDMSFVVILMINTKYKSTMKSSVIPKDLKMCPSVSSQSVKDFGLAHPFRCAQVCHQLNRILKTVENMLSIDSSVQWRTEVSTSLLFASKQ